MSLTGKSPLTDDKPLSNDGFWPELSTGDLMQRYRIPSEYDNPVIETGLMLAMIRVNQQLDLVKNQMQLLTYATLAEYSAANSEQVNSIEVLQTKYEHAVYARAKAGLLQQFKTMNRRAVAENEAKESAETEAYWLDQSQAGIKSFFDLMFVDHNVSASANVFAELL